VAFGTGRLSRGRRVSSSGRAIGLDDAEAKHLARLISQALA
jgi:hypothetical protein